MARVQHRVGGLRSSLTARFFFPRSRAGEEALASVLLDGIYFGEHARLAWGLYAQPRPLATEVKAALTKLHGRLADQAALLGIAFS